MLAQPRAWAWAFARERAGRSKTFRVMGGYIPKAGEPARQVAVAHVTAYPKSGAIGVLVRIVLPGTIFPDKVAGAKVEIARVIEAADDITAATPNEVVQKVVIVPMKKRRPMQRRR